MNEVLNDDRKNEINRVLDEAWNASEALSRGVQ